MTRGYLPILILFFIIAIIFRDDFVFMLFYVFIGAYIFGNLWSKRAIKQVEITRKLDTHAFLGEKFTVRLEINNRGLLPIPWLRIHEGLPLELSSQDSLQNVISLRPRQRETIDYQLIPRKRGYYKVGPLYMRTGDLFGVSREIEREHDENYLTVYPRILPLESLDIPSSSPSGTMRHHQPIYEDASRIFGKRDYQPGDSIRRIDWKSTASSRKLQVKLFEPSINLDTMIFLNLYGESYPIKTRHISGEMAITVAASIAAWLVSKGQSVGLSSNGMDEIYPSSMSFIPSAKGNYQLMSILELLARLQLQDLTSSLHLFEQYRSKLQWGTTLVLISGDVTEAVWGEVINAQQAGLEVMIFIIGSNKRYQVIESAAYQLGIKSTRLAHELDLQTWQRSHQAKSWMRG